MPSAVPLSGNKLEYMHNGRQNTYQRLQDFQCHLVNMPDRIFRGGRERLRAAEGCTICLPSTADAVIKYEFGPYRNVARETS